MRILSWFLLWASAACVWLPVLAAGARPWRLIWHCAAAAVDSLLRALR